MTRLLNLVLRLAIVLLLIWSVSGHAQTPIPVTGNLSQILGSPQPYAAVSLQLQNCPAPVTIPGTAIIVQTQLEIQANASGIINSQVWPVDVIDCNGTTGNSQYAVTYIVGGVPSANPACYAPTSTIGTWNLQTLQPVTCGQTPPNPQDATFQNIQVIQNTSVNTLQATGATTVILNGLNLTNAFTSTQGAGHFATEGLATGMLVPSTSTAFQANAFSAFMENHSTATAGVGGYFQASAGAANTVNWSINPICSDFDSSGTTYSGVTCYGIEIDMNALHAGTAGAGILAQGNLSANTSAGNIGIINAPLPAAGKWNYGANFADGFAYPNGSAMIVGAITPTAGQSSFPITFRAYNSMGAALLSAFYLDASGFQHIEASGGTVIDGGVLVSKAGTYTAGTTAGDMVLYNGNYLSTDTPAHNANVKLIGTAPGTATVSIDPLGQGAFFGGSIGNANGVLLPSTLTGYHGNSTKVQISDGSGSAGDLAAFDANGNTTDGGGTATSIGTGSLVRASTLPLSGVTSSIGGSALAAGQCSAGSVTIMGATAGMTGVAAATDGSYQAGYIVQALGVTTNTATVEVCAIAAGTPTAKTYNVRLIQ